MTQNGPKSVTLSLAKKTKQTQPRESRWEGDFRFGFGCVCFVLEVCGGWFVRESRLGSVFGRFVLFWQGV